MAGGHGLMRSYSASAGRAMVKQTGVIRIPKITKRSQKRNNPLIGSKDGSKSAIQMKQEQATGSWGNARVETLSIAMAAREAFWTAAALCRFPPSRSERHCLHH